MKFATAASSPSSTRKTPAIRCPAWPSRWAMSAACWRPSRRIHGHSLRGIGDRARHHQAGRLQLAEQVYRSILAAEPGHAEAYNNLGAALAAQGKLDEAAARFRRAIELRPEYGEAHNNLGNALRDQGKVDEAAASYRRALELTPDDARIHNNLGSRCRTRESWKKRPPAIAGHWNSGRIMPRPIIVSATRCWPGRPGGGHCRLPRGCG